MTVDQSLLTLRPGDMIRVDGDWPETKGRVFRVLFIREHDGTLVCRGSDQKARTFPLHDVSREPLR
jgi:hypothetical protein